MIRPFGDRSKESQRADFFNQIRPVREVHPQFIYRLGFPEPAAHPDNGYGICLQ